MRMVFFDIGGTLVTSQGDWQQGAKTCLSQLRVSNVKLGLISNTGNLSRDELKARLPPDFDFSVFVPEAVLLSSEVGLEKPDLAIFLHAVRTSGRPAIDCVFVGENLSESWAAQLAGMRSIRVRAFPDDLDDLPALVASNV